MLKIMVVLASAFLSVYAISGVEAKQVSPVDEGGTGRATLDANAFILGNGIGPVISSSSPALLQSAFNSYIYTNAAIPSVSGDENGDLLYWTGSIWNAASPSELGLGGGGSGGAGGSDYNIQYGLGGSLQGNSALYFNPTHTNIEATGPTFILGNENTTSLKFLTRYPDPLAIIRANDAPAGSGQEGAQLQMYSGFGDGSAKGGTLWLMSGGSNGSGRNGDILIAANNGGASAGSILIDTTNGFVHVHPTDVTLSGGVSGVNINNEGITFQSSANVRFFGIPCLLIDGNCVIKLNASVPAVDSGASNCGDSPDIKGTDNAGRITVGTGVNGGTCTITFASSDWSNPPVCHVQNETSAQLVRGTNITKFKFEAKGTFAEGDVLSYQCVGY